MKRATSNTASSVAEREDLHQEIERLRRENEQLRAERDAAVDANTEAQREIDRLEEQIAKYRHHAFARSSERLHPGQGSLFVEPGLTGDSDEPTRHTPDPAVQAADDESAEQPPPRRRSPRKPRSARFSDKVKTTIVEHPVEDTCCAGCGNEMTPAGVDETEELEYVPAHFERRIHRRHKVACRTCLDNVVRAPVPKRPLPKSLPGITLAVWIVISKYVDHLPLHRLARKFRRLGADLPSSTLCDWVLAIADRLMPIVEAMREEILASNYIQTDDTPVQTLLLHGRKRSVVQAHLWPYLAEDQVVFDFTLSRSRDGPERFLGPFRGSLQSDAYSGYSRLRRRPEIVGVGCMAHARRKFHEARVAKAPLEKVLPVMAAIGRLYEVESLAIEEEMDEIQRLELRRQRSRSILATLLREVRRLEGDPAVLPKSALGSAVQYFRRQRKSLTRFVRDGKVEIDNNRVERCIRPVALGRKNWLFAGSERGGRAAACLYSLVESCQLIGIDLEAYLWSALEAMNQDADPRGVTPKRWRQSQRAADRPEAGAQTASP